MDTACQSLVDGCCGNRFRDSDPDALTSTAEHPRNHCAPHFAAVEDSDQNRLTTLPIGPELNLKGGGCQHFLSISMARLYIATFQQFLAYRNILMIRLSRNFPEGISPWTAPLSPRIASRKSACESCA
jgi:hypothetical protein